MAGGSRLRLATLCGQDVAGGALSGCATTVAGQSGLGPSHAETPEEVCFATTGPGGVATRWSSNTRCGRTVWRSPRGWFSTSASSAERRLALPPFESYGQ